MNEIVYLSTDLETTGLSRQARICEICIIAWDKDGNQVRKYLQRLNPGCPIPLAASQVHGIFDRHVQEEPDFSHVVTDIANALKWAHRQESTPVDFTDMWIAPDRQTDPSLPLPLVGHNIVAYDIPILRAHFEEAGVPMPEINPVDTLKLARTRWPKHPDGNKLTVVASRLGISEKNDSHGAEVDTIVVGEVYARLLTGLEYEPTEESAILKQQQAETLAVLDDVLSDFDFA